MFRLGDKLRRGDAVLSLWQTMPSVQLALGANKGGLDAVVMDVQHGEFSLKDVMVALPALHGAGIGTAVRIAAHDYAFAARAVDAGVEAIIAPLINTADDVRMLVDAIKYPPVGGRSWGPGAAMHYAGIDDPQEQLRTANSKVLAFAMIETVEGLGNLDAILAVEGLDGILVGPSDLSIALSNGAQIDQFGAPSLPVIESIAQKTLAAGKLTACFTSTPDQTRQALDFGYGFVSVGTDSSLFISAVADRLSKVAPDTY